MSRSKMKLNYKSIILIILIAAIALRFILLFIAPISMFADGVIRYLPLAEKMLHGDFSTNELPLFILLETFWMLLFKGGALFIALKLTSFIFFIATIFLLPSLLKKLELKRNESIILLALFFFSTWSMLLSVTILQDMMIAFFTIALFITIENYFEKKEKKWLFLSLILAILMTLTKLTGYFILAGFVLYIFSKSRNNKIKIKIKEKINAVLYLVFGTIVGALWLVKNYIKTGLIHIISIESPIYIHPFAEYVDYFVRFYHYFWEIPMPGKVALSGIFSSGYNFYYILALIVTIFISLLLIFSLFRYGKKYKEYLLLMLPLFAFAFYWVFIIFLGFHDAGRYTFPLWPFLFFFLVKFISRLENKNTKKLCYVFIVLFCILSIISAFGIAIHMNSIDGQVIDMAEFLGKENLEKATIISNDEFTASSLAYYLRKPVEFNMPRNVIDPDVKCGGINIFQSRNFDVFKEREQYRICRK